MKQILLAAMAALLPLWARAQTTEELTKGANDQHNVLNYGMGYNLQRFSPIDQINKDNVKDLVPVWNYSYDDNRSEESQPLVYNGVLYVTTNSATMAIDAKTGRQIWKTKVDYPSETPRIVCCGIINRGAALYDGKVYRTTLDANVVARDAKTGKEVWKQNAIDFKTGYSMTVAPLVADGVIITGISGAEFGTRLFIDGWDAQTGQHLWRTYTIPGPGEPGHETWPGDTWEHGAARPGSPARSTPSSIPFIGASAIPGRSTLRFARATTSTPTRSWRSIRRPARSSGITSSRPTIRSITTASPK